MTIRHTRNPPSRMSRSKDPAENEAQVPLTNEERLRQVVTRVQEDLKRGMADLDEAMKPFLVKSDKKSTAICSTLTISLRSAEETLKILEKGREKVRK